MEASQCKAELLECREQESSAKMNALSTENVALKTRITVRCHRFVPVTRISTGYELVFMPSPVSSCQRHPVFMLSVCLSVSPSPPIDNI